MNPLASLIESQFENRNALLALVFFLLQFILLAALRLYFGVQLGLGMVVMVLRELASWIVLTVLLMVLLRAFKGAEAKGKFGSVFSAYSVTYLVIFFGALLFSLLNYAVLGPAFLKGMSGLTADSSVNDAIALLSSMQLPSEGTIWLFLALSAIIGIATGLLFLYTVYAIGQLTKKTSAFSNLVFLVVFIAISIFVNSALTVAFQPLLASTP